MLRKTNSLDFLKRSNINGLNIFVKGRDTFFKNVCAHLNEWEMFLRTSLPRGKALLYHLQRRRWFVVSWWCRLVERDELKRGEMSYSSNDEYNNVGLTSTPEKTIDFDRTNTLFKFYHIGFIVPWFHLHPRRRPSRSDCLDWELTSRVMLLLAIITGSTTEEILERRKCASWTITIRFLRSVGS